MALNLTLEEERFLKGCKMIVVIGLPASGKTFVADFLQADLLSDHSIYHTDDYIDFGYKESLYAMMKEMEYDANPRKIVEGVQAYRYLRKNQERGGVHIDAVIHVAASPEARQKRYTARGKGNLSESFEKNLATIYAEYLAKLPESALDKPRFITVFT